jgi:hypothetical protein
MSDEEPTTTDELVQVPISKEIMDVMPRMMRASGNPKLTTNEFLQVLLSEFAQARNWELEFDNPSPFTASAVRVYSDADAADQPGGIFAADRRAGTAASDSGNDAIMDALADIQGRLGNIEAQLRPKRTALMQRLFGR